MKKRNCRRTPEENMAHDQAVKIRKMTDEQIVDYITKIKEDAYSDGCRKAEGNNKVKEFIDLITEYKPYGIGTATLNKIIKIAEDYGFI